MEVTLTYLLTIKYFFILVSLFKARHELHSGKTCGFWKQSEASETVCWKFIASNFCRIGFYKKLNFCLCSVCNMAVSYFLSYKNPYVVQQGLHVWMFQQFFSSFTNKKSLQFGRIVNNFEHFFWLVKAYPLEKITLRFFWPFLNTVAFLKRRLECTFSFAIEVIIFTSEIISWIIFRLQVISSLLELQSKVIKVETCDEILQNIIDRFLVSSSEWVNNVFFFLRIVRYRNIMKPKDICNGLEGLGFFCYWYLENVCIIYMLIIVIPDKQCNFCWFQGI